MDNCIVFIIIIVLVLIGTLGVAALDGMFTREGICRDNGYRWDWNQVSCHEIKGNQIVEYDIMKRGGYWYFAEK